MASETLRVYWSVEVRRSFPLISGRHIPSLTLRVPGDGGLKPSAGDLHREALSNTPRTESEYDWVLCLNAITFGPVDQVAILRTN